MHFLPITIPGSTTTLFPILQSSAIIAPIISSLLNSSSISRVAFPVIVEKFDPIIDPFPIIECEIDEKEGALMVTSVIPNGTADSAGIETGDEITTFNGEPITSKNQLTYAMQIFGPDTICPIGLKRSGKTINRFVILKAIE